MTMCHIQLVQRVWVNKYISFSHTLITYHNSSLYNLTLDSVRDNFTSLRMNLSMDTHPRRHANTYIYYYYYYYLIFSEFFTLVLADGFSLEFE